MVCMSECIDVCVYAGEYRSITHIGGGIKAKGVIVYIIQLIPIAPPPVLTLLVCVSMSIAL
jgi:hypothetical protein